jgi:hypothetical protein
MASKPQRRPPAASLRSDEREGMCGHAENGAMALHRGILAMGSLNHCGRVRVYGRSCALEELAQLPFGALQNAPPTFGQVLAGPIDVERQHGHRRAKRRRLAPRATLRRPLEQTGNVGWIVLGKNLALQIQRVAGARDALGPSSPTRALGLAGRCRPLFDRVMTAESWQRRLGRIRLADLAPSRRG